jgi:hypothetical protein
MTENFLPTTYNVAKSLLCSYVALLCGLDTVYIQFCVRSNRIAWCEKCYAGLCISRVQVYHISEMYLDEVGKKLLHIKQITAKKYIQK